MRKSFFAHMLLLAVMAMALTRAASAGILLSITIAPPPLPVYEQPVCPGDGYIWTPGYWAYGDDGFFWVPGTWVLIPEPGLLWTPGYWGWADGLYVFHEGYWGPHVGFYGGINYGFGYTGVGYEGGYWDRGAFFYNRSVNHVDHVRNVYNRTVVNNITINNVSYNGGSGGIAARPTQQQEEVQRERHIPPVSAQTQHLQTASTDRQLYESANHGKPPVAATARPADFNGRGVVAAKAAARSYTPPAARTAATPSPSAQPAARAPEAPSPAGAAPNPAHPPAPAVPNGAAPNGAPPRSAAPVHPSDLQPQTRTAPNPNPGASKADQKFQQQQDKLFARQDQDRQKLQQKQEQEHQRINQSSPNPQKQQQMEQRHQQQTQQLQQRQAGQQQKLQARQPQPKSNPQPKPNPHR